MCNMIHTLQHNWNVLTSIYNIVALLCASVAKCRFFYRKFYGCQDGRATNTYVYHMQVHCHSSMPIKSLAEAQLIWRETSILFSDTIFRSSESKASVVCLKINSPLSIRKIALLIQTKVACPLTNIFCLTTLCTVFKASCLLFPCACTHQQG